MRKNFRLIAAVSLVVTVNLAAWAQEKTHKDVILDGQPAKLDLKTGEVKKLQDSTKQKTEIQANLITNKDFKKDKNQNVIVTNKPDTLAQYYKNLLKQDSLKSSISNSDIKTLKDSSLNVGVTNDVILIASENDEVNDEEEDTVENASISSYNSNNGMYVKSTTDFHLVQKGETLYSLARLYDTTLGQLKLANGLETTLIEVGQKLRIRNFDTQRNLSIWTVSKGDTLYSIAKKNNTTVASLKALNGLTGDLIYPGQKLQY